MSAAHRHRINETEWNIRNAPLLSEWVCMRCRSRLRQARIERLSAVKDLAAQSIQCACSGALPVATHACETDYCYDLHVTHGNVEPIPSTTGLSRRRPFTLAVSTCSLLCSLCGQQPRRPLAHRRTLRLAAYSQPAWGTTRFGTRTPRTTARVAVSGESVVVLCSVVGAGRRRGNPGPWWAISQQPTATAESRQLIPGWRGFRHNLVFHGVHEILLQRDTLGVTWECCSGVPLGSPAQQRPLLHSNSSVRRAESSNRQQTSAYVVQESLKCTAASF